MNRLEGTGDAVIFKGDPRRVGNSFDEWVTGILSRGTREGGIRKRPYLYGSDAGFCSRRNVLLQENVWLENTVNSAGRGYMAIGVAFEDLLVEGLRKEGRFLASQLRGVELPGLKISSKFDGIILDADNNLALIEVKTCGKLPTEEKPQHLAQIQTYAAISGIRNAYLIYMSRDLHPLKPISIATFRVDTSDDALKGRLKIAAESCLAAKVKKLPPVPAKFRKHTECHYCEFRDHFCWGGRKGKGDEPAQPPLPELTPEAYMVLSSKAETWAGELLEGMAGRLLETIREIKGSEEISTKQHQRLLELYTEAQAAI